MQRRSISRYAIGKRGREREREGWEGRERKWRPTICQSTFTNFLASKCENAFPPLPRRIAWILDLWTNNCLVSFFAILLQFIRWDKNLWREEEKKMIPWLNIWIIININTSCTKFNIDFSYPKYISQLLVIYLYTIILMEFILRCLVYTRFLLHEFLLLI